jgi:hypothetical protein
VRWGLSREGAAAIVGDLLERAPAAIAAASEETADVPADLVSTIERRLTHLGLGRETDPEDPRGTRAGKP